MKPDQLPYRLLLILLLWLSGLGVSRAQQLRLLTSVPIRQVQAVSIDRLGLVYAADQKNTLYKFDAGGKRLLSYSPALAGQLAFVEAWNPVKTLLFYDDRQQITLLDRFLTPITTIRLADLTDGPVRAATLASDDQLWLLNERDFSLIKIDPRYPDTRLKTKLNQILPNGTYDLRMLREYQNTLYLVDRLSGIYLFDTMGNYKKRLPVINLEYLGFKGNEAYYLKDGHLVFFNLYTLQERTVSVPAGKPYRLALASEEAIYLFSPTHLDIYLPAK